MNGGGSQRCCNSPDGRSPARRGVRSRRDGSGRSAALLAAAPILLLPALAGAQDTAAPPPPAIAPGVWLAAAVLLAAVLALVIWQRRLLTRQTARADDAGQSVARLEAVLAAAPQGWCAFSEDGTTAVSDGFVSLLGIAEVAAIEDVEAALAPGDAASLHAAFAALRRDGTAFARIVRTPAGRAVEVIGRRGRGPSGGAAFDVLFAADVTPREAERTRQAELADQSKRVETELVTLLDALPVPVWLRRADLSIGWVNRAYAAAVDAGRDRVVAEGIELAKGQLGADGRDLARRVRDDDAAAGDRRHVVIDGERRLVEITERPLDGGGDGHPRRMVGWAVDLTEAEEAHAELGRHIAAHREVLEHLKTAIAIFGADKRLTFFNQAYVQLWHFDEAWLESGPTYQEMLEDLRARRRLPEYADFRAFKQGQNALFTSLIEPQEDLMHLPDGTTLRAVVTPHPFGGLLFVLEDVTSALTLERNYNTLMAVQRESLDNLAEGVAVFGSDGRLQLSNPAYARLWGLDDSDIDGTPHIGELLDRMRRFYSDEQDWQQTRRLMLDGALERDARHARLERADGRVIDYVTVPLPDGGVLNSFLDITASAQVETALRRSNEALETADRLKSEFIANVSYQLRTPLNAIMGFAEILNKQYFGELNDRQADYSRSILDASDRLLSLINDILDLATIEAGYMALERREVDIGDLVRSVHDLTREWAGKQSLKLGLDVPEDIGTIEADDRRLKQALYNLVSNAVKFTPAGGRITMAARREDDHVRLSVVDTGIGIPESEQRRVFGRFERVHPEMRQSGVGLGLALVKSFVELHGGRLELVSRPGEGTVVSCVLPIRPPDPAARRAEAPADAPQAAAAASPALGSGVPPDAAAGEKSLMS
jgi:signal transduction histidine kinase